MCPGVSVYVCCVVLCVPRPLRSTRTQADYISSYPLTDTPYQVGDTGMSFLRQILAYYTGDVFTKV